MEQDQFGQAYKVVQQSLRSQGGRRHSKEALESLTQHLMSGGQPGTFAERFAQMALIMQGLLPHEA